MKIAFNPFTKTALQAAPQNNDIIFDLAGHNIYARGVKFAGTDTTYDVFKKDTSNSIGGRIGLVPVPDYNNNSQTRFLREDGTWANIQIPTSTTYTFEGGVNSFKVTPSNGTTQTIQITPNVTLNDILCSNYTIATEIKNIATTDTLNTALGKLEYKADLGVTAYNLISAANNGESIDNLAEILKVLEGIKDTETIQAIIGKYLPLTGGTLTGDNNILNLSGTTNSYIYYRLGSTNKASSGYYENFAFIANEKTYARIGVADDGTPQYHTDNHKTNVYTLLHSGIAHISNGTITINGTSITPITSHQDLSNYRRLDITQMYGTEICSQYYIARCKADGGGWAYAPIAVFKGDKTSKLLNIGVYGGGYALTYSYIGQNEWSGANLRIYPAGNIYCVGAEIDGHTSTKGASIAGYASSNSITSIADLKDSGLYVGFNTREAWGLTMWVEGNGKGYIQQQAIAGTTYALNLNPFGGNVGIGTRNPGYTLDVAGSINSATGFYKTGSSNDYVLLGAGGHKAISDFMLKSDELTNNLTTITKTLTVTKDWMDTGIVLDAATFPNGNGSYAVQIEREGCYYFTGYMTIMPSISGGITVDYSDEIVLHGGGFDMSGHYYLRTKHDKTSKTIKLQIAYSTNSAASKTLTFKFKKLI